jgi:hypothetical protein
MKLFGILRNGAIALGVLAVIHGCSEGPSEVDQTNAGAEPLRNGSGLSERMKGVVELVNILTGERCSGLLLNAANVLTTAHCAARVTRVGARSDDTFALQANTYSWNVDEGSFVKHCLSSPNSVCENRDSGKISTVHLYSLGMSIDNDLAIIRVPAYPDWTFQNDFAEIYLDDITPANTPRLQLYSWGQVGDGNTNPQPKPRTGTMQVLETTSGRVKLKADQVQSCAGDEGAPWTIPSTVSGSGNKVVALESRFTPDTATKCSATNGTEYATRLASKVDWIQSLAGPCSIYTDFAGHSALRCFALDCDGAPPESSNAWDGCRGSGCAVCAEAIDAYPKYFDHHRNCTRNTTCDNQFYRCSSACPAPTDADR